MFLKDYIEEYCGDNYREADRQLAKKFGVTERAVQSWRLQQRVPMVEIARVIVRKTGGMVDYEGIYAPYRNIRNR